MPIKFPIVKTTLFLVIGIIFRELFKVPEFITLSLIVLVIISYLFLSKKTSFNKTPLLLFLLILSGYFIYDVHKSSLKIINKNSSSEAHFHAEIDEISLPKNQIINLIVKVDSSISYKKVESGNYSVLTRISIANFNKTKFYEKFSPGNKILIYGKLITPKSERIPGDFNYKNYLEQKGISGTIFLNDVNNIKLISNEYDYFEDLILHTRLGITNLLERLHNHETSALLKGLLLGERSDISYDVNEAFVNTGIAHILSVSGLHTAFVVMLFYFLFSSLHVYLRTGLTITGLLLFMLITGMPVPVVRASIMASVLLISKLSGRSSNLYNSLALSAFVILIVAPVQLFDPGFQLSYLAVMSIGYLYPLMKNLIVDLKIPQWIKSLLIYISVSIAAQIGTLPLIALYFGKISLISILANLIAIPATGWLLASGFASLIAGSIWHSLASLFANFNNLVTLLLYNILFEMNNIKFSYLTISSFTLTDCILSFIFLVMFLICINKIKNVPAKVVIAFLLFLNLYLFISFDKELLNDNKLNVVMIDVGQGDSYLLKFPNGKSCLIDAGLKNNYLDASKSSIMPFLSKLNIRQIDYAFLTHYDLDHAGGFVTLIMEKKIKKFYIPEMDTSKASLEFIAMLNEYNIPFEKVNYKIINEGNARIYILNKKTIRYEDSNDESLFLKVSYGEIGFLFTGDASSKVEKSYCNLYGNFLESEVLKLSHHGSKTGTSDLLLGNSDPEYALISCGQNNRYKHPSTEVVEKLRLKNIKIFRTDTEGSIILASDGKRIDEVEWKN